MNPRSLLIMGDVLCAATAQGRTQESAVAATDLRTPVRTTGEMVTISTSGSEGLSLEELLGWWSEISGRKFIYSESDLRGKPRIQVTGTVSVKKAEADAFFQFLLVRAGFALVPSGPEAANAWAVEFIPSSTSLKLSAAFIPRERLPSVREQPARVFMTTFQLRHVRIENFRAAFTQVITNRSCEMIQEIPANNSIMVISFGPTLCMLDQIVTAADVPPPDTPLPPELHPRPPKEKNPEKENK